MCQFSDQFYAAVRTLSGNGPIKQRLATAYCDNLEYIRDEDIPDNVRPRFDLLRRQMHTTRPMGDESPAVASIRKMSAADASGCASLIVAMFSELVCVESTGERLNLIHQTPEPQIADHPWSPAVLN